MCIPFIRSFLVPAAFIVHAVLGTPSVASASDEIPTQLRNAPRGDDLNGPCSLCRVNSIKAAKDVAGSEATLELYFDDEQSPLCGSLELTVLLASGEYHTVVIEDVTLAWRQITAFELEPVEGWDWSLDVEHIWVEAIPAGG